MGSLKDVSQMAIDGLIAAIAGFDELYGASMIATDIRAGAALVSSSG